MALKVNPVSIQTSAPFSPAVDETTAKIRQTALAIIRQAMPIETLFNWKLEINLGVFLEDQIFFCRLAEFIASCDATTVVEKLADSEFVKRFKDTPHYLTLFHEACVDVLKNPTPPTHLKRAIEGRIFTLRNALVAQHEPERILKSQSHKQKKEAIQEEGKQFIRETLGLYVSMIKTPQSGSFREELTSVVEQLVPFVRKVTTMYINELGYPCPEDSLRFRDPTGYNHHGFVAATVMEVCLNALGYTTRFMANDRLEPKVTSSHHILVEITDPNGLKYIVDPTYVQFHKEIYLDQRAVPSGPVLVLLESEVDSYVESDLMNQWKSNLQLLKDKKPGIKQQLEKQDQHTSLTIHEFNLPLVAQPKDQENWVRKALRSVWDLSAYEPIVTNEGFQEIFYGTGMKKETFKQIQSLGLAAMTNRMPSSHIEKELVQLQKDQTYHNKNHVKALELLVKIPESTRDKYDILFDLDPRLNPPVRNFIQAYYRELKKMVNPDSRDITAVYGCSGPDCISVLLATDATELFFVDSTDLDVRRFQQALTDIKNEKEEVLKFLEQEAFFRTRGLYMSSKHGHDNQKYFTNGIEIKLLFNLKSMGVDLNKMALSSIEKGVVITFPWQYYGSSHAKLRKLTCVAADLEKPSSYPQVLQQTLEAGIDLFYLKSAGSTPLSYPQFLPTFAQALKSCGFLMTADQTQDGEIVNPSSLLEQHQLNFKILKSNEALALEKLMHSPIGPCSTMGCLQMWPSPADRWKRMKAVSGASYHTILTVRQKQE
jgi:hypothetical protein